MNLLAWAHTVTQFCFEHGETVVQTPRCSGSNTHITGCSATQTCEVQKPRGVKGQLIVTLDLDMLQAPNTHVHGRN